MITCFSVSKSSPRSVGRRMSERTSKACGQVLGQAGDVVERVFLGGLGVVLGADAVEVAIDGQRRRACGVPLKVMCSRKCETPASSLDSSRLPVLTKNPAATECAWSFSSAMTSSPLSSVVWWNCIGVRLGEK